jgi:hypothetical protein
MWLVSACIETREQKEGGERENKIEGGKRENKREGGGRGGKERTKETVEATDRKKRNKKSIIYKKSIEPRKKETNVQVQKRVRHETHDEQRAEGDIEAAGCVEYLAHNQRA